MNVIGISGLDNSIRFKTREFPSLSARQYRIAQGYDSAAATSFNVRGQPIVCTPEEALDTFLSAGLHALVLGNYVVVPASDACRTSAQQNNRV